MITCILSKSVASDVEGYSENGLDSNETTEVGER